MEKKCKHLFPLKNVTIRKVKTIRRPKLDNAQLQSMQTEEDVKVGVPKKPKEITTEKK